jgi:hypothetical protein
MDQILPDLLLAPPGFEDCFLLQVEKPRTSAVLKKIETVPQFSLNSIFLKRINGSKSDPKANEIL